MSKKAKHGVEKSNNKYLKNVVIVILTILIIIGIGYIINYIYTKNNNQCNIDDIKIDESKISNNTTKRMLQLRELKKENEDIIGWLEIEKTTIDFPVLQGEDNDYYMTHTYKKQYSKDGSIFLDKDYKWDPPSSNLLIYGHNNKDGNMFEGLLKYKEESYYKKHPRIKFTTIDEDCEYEIISTFLSRVYYKSEKDVFRYYYFLNAENEEEYNNYIEESKKASLYDTGVNANYGEQLITLTTCDYSQEDGRFVIVGKKVK